MVWQIGNTPTGTPKGDTECRGYEKIAIFGQYIVLGYLGNGTR